MPKLISWIIPLYNEENVLEELWRRVSAQVDALTQYKIQVIFVDDGSQDRTAEKVKEICRQYSYAKYLGLSRNFGHQSALKAGLDAVGDSDAVILMDGDLQDQPEVIPRFLAEWEAGNQVVYAVRKSRKENVVKRGVFWVFYKMLTSMSGIDQPMNAGVFGLMDKCVVEVLQKMPEHKRYFPGLRAYAGFKQTGIPIDRGERYDNEPRVGLKGLFNLAFDALFSFSYLPIRIVTVTGMLIALCAFVYSAIVLYHKLVSGKAVTGWASQLVAILFLGGIQLIMIGIVGEYVGRIYEEIKGRPIYIVGERINF